MLIICLFGTHYVLWIKHEWLKEKEILMIFYRLHVDIHIWINWLSTKLYTYDASYILANSVVYV